MDRSLGLLSEREKWNVHGTAKLLYDQDLSGMEVVVYLEQECDELMVSTPRAQRNPYSGTLFTCVYYYYILNKENCHMGEWHKAYATVMLVLLSIDKRKPLTLPPL